MTSSQGKAYQFRRFILIMGILFTTAGIIWLILPFFNEMFDRQDGEGFFGLMGTVLGLYQVMGNSGELGYLANLIVVVGLLLLAQWSFLRPGKNWKVRMLGEGRPLKTSIFAAALMAMLLTTGLITLIMEIPNWWQPLMENDGKLVVAFSIYAVMGVVWGIWAWIFWVYWKQGDRYTQLGKMIRGLVAGSILEVIVAVPVHIWATRQRECYCCRGTYTTLVLGATVLIWAFGPGIILLYWRETYRREKLMNDRGEAKQEG